MQNKTRNTASSESSETIKAYNTANEELTKIRHSLIIFNNTRTGFGSIISYHKGTNIPVFFPREYQESNREEIFDTIDSAIDQTIEKVSQVQGVTGNKTLDDMFATRVQRTIQQLKNFKDLKYLEAEKLGYTFTSKKNREKRIETAQKVILHKKNNFINSQNKYS